MKITNIKKMSGGKYKISLDNKKDMTLYEDVIIKNILLSGKNVDDNLMNKITKDNNEAMIYNQSLKYISLRIRSEEELKIYLNKKNYDEKDIEKTIEKLKKAGYINDQLFAASYTNDKINLTNDGPNKIRQNLTNLKVEETIISNVISNIDEEIISNKIDKLINKQIKANKKYSGFILKNKILNYMINLGYDKDEVLKKLESIDFSNNKDIQKEYQKLYKKYSPKYSGTKLDMVIKQKLYQKGYDISSL
ncbi:MAG TPA: hypothetical protein GX725_04225 [Mollicutes bacterium]|nr:hypothetical protein [Mollicutes bacterium]